MKAFFSFQVGDFVLVELSLEEGRNLGTLVCYVAKVLSFEEDDEVQLSFLRMKSAYQKDTFTFPTIEDVYTVACSQVKGVLPIVKRTTQRQANLVKVKTPLHQFNMRL